MSRTRVLFINTAKARSLGAGPWLHAKVMTYLDRSRVDIHAACAGGDGSAPDPPMLAMLLPLDDIDLQPVDFGPDSFGQALRYGWRGALASAVGVGHLLRSSAKLGILARRRRVQIIHTDERPRDALVAVVLARLSGAQSIVHMHVGYGDWMSPLLKWSMKRADALFAVSEFVAASLRDSGHDPDRIHVVLNAIDAVEWKGTGGRAEVREELDIPVDAPVIITVCRLVPGKGTDELIEALPATVAEFPTLRLVVVGEEQKPGYRDELLDLAARLGVREHVITTGRRNDVPRLMAAADLFVMLSEGEPFGLVYLEAMATGLPVIANRIGGPVEFIDDGVNGTLIEPGDRSALISSLLAYLRDPARRRAVGEAGRRHVAEHFDMPRMADDVSRQYELLLSRAERG